MAKEYSLAELVGLDENSFVPKMEKILADFSN
jgi:hypothetical protein